MTISGTMVRTVVAIVDFPLLCIDQRVKGAP
jgi:hypothetical protein